MFPDLLHHSMFMRGSAKLSHWNLSFFPETLKISITYSFLSMLMLICLQLFYQFFFTFSLKPKVEFKTTLIHPLQTLKSQEFSSIEESFFRLEKIITDIINIIWKMISSKTLEKIFWKEAHGCFLYSSLYPKLSEESLPAQLSKHSQHRKTEKMALMKKIGKKSLASFFWEHRLNYDFEKLEIAGRLTLKA